MLITTNGVVLKHFKYSENSVIAKIYTEDYGLQSFLVRGVRSGKSKNKASYVQPLSLVQVTTTYKEQKSLHNVKSIQLAQAYNDIPFNIVKTSLAFFLAEVLLKSIQEEENNPALFEYLFNTFQYLDVTQESCANFHLIFMAQLCKFLGFKPQLPIDVDQTYFFDLQEGLFLSHVPPHKEYTAPEKSALLIQLFLCNFKNNNLKLNATLRKSLLGVLLDYYHLHLSNFDNLKSLEVLEEVMS